MLRNSVLPLLALLLPSCASMSYGPQNSQELAATQQARNLLWVIEADNGGVIGSATAIGPGRLLASANTLEIWNPQQLRVRRGTTVLPVQSMRLSVSQDFAILNIPEPSIAAPALAERPRTTERLAIAGANDGGVFTGLGPIVADISHPVEGLRSSDKLVLAELPAASGFAGAPVVNVDGRLVGIANSLVLRGSLHPQVPQRVDPGAAIPRQTLAIVPMELVNATIQAEGMDRLP